MALIDCPECNGTLYKVMKNLFHCRDCGSLFELQLRLIGEMSTVKEG